MTTPAGQKAANETPLQIQFQRRRGAVFYRWVSGGKVPSDWKRLTGKHGLLPADGTVLGVPAPWLAR